MKKSRRKPVVQGIREMVGGRIEAARTALDKSGGDEAIHTARKQLKGARAGLRVLRGAVGEYFYVRQNARLRDAGRPLSRVRDAKVLIDTARALLEEAGRQRDRKVLTGLLRMLRNERKTLRKKALGENLKPTVSALRQTEGTLAKLKLDASGDTLTQDTKRLYRKGRKALGSARDERSDDALHEARKQTKYLMHALRVLEVTGARRVAKRIKLAEAIGDDLGLDHDLVLIQAKVSELPSTQSRTSETLVEDLKQRRRKLQRKAFRKGKRLYEGRPGEFVESLGIA